LLFHFAICILGGRKAPLHSETLSVKSYQQFGAVAIRKGYVTHEQLTAALDRQQEIPRQGGKWKLIGIVMLGMGLLDNDQLIDILRYYENERLPSAQPEE